MKRIRHRKRMKQLKEDGILAGVLVLVMIGICLLIAVPSDNKKAHDTDQSNHALIRTI